MKTPTLVLAAILAMAVVGDSSKMEKILKDLGFPAEEETFNGASVTPTSQTPEKDKGEDFTMGPGKALDLVNSITLASHGSGQKGKASTHETTMQPTNNVPEASVGGKVTPTPANPTIHENALTPTSEKVGPDGRETTVAVNMNPTKEKPEKDVAMRFTSRPAKVLDHVKAETTASEEFSTEEVTEGMITKPTTALDPANAIVSASENVGQEDVVSPDNSYDLYDWFNYEDTGSGENYVYETDDYYINEERGLHETIEGQNSVFENEDYKDGESGLDATVEDVISPEMVEDGVYSVKDYSYKDDTRTEDGSFLVKHGDNKSEDHNYKDAGSADGSFLVKHGDNKSEEHNYEDGGSGQNGVYETEDYKDGEKGLDAIVEGVLETMASNPNESTDDPTFKRGVLDRLPSPLKQLLDKAKGLQKYTAKAEAVAYLKDLAKGIGRKVADKLGDRIAAGVSEDHQEKVVSGLQDYLGKQSDKFDDEYKELLKDTSGLAAGLNRPVEEADIQLLPRAGATMGNMYAPPGWEIRHKYKYKEDSDKSSPAGQAAPFTYPVGLGPVLMNGCFGTGYKNGDPCYKAKIPLPSCPRLIDGATYLGVGFDARGVYSAESRKKSLIQRSCNNLQKFGQNQVPDSMTVQGIYDTDVESRTFSSTEEYRHYLEEKSAVTSAKAMFQEEIDKASGHGVVGPPFGLVGAIGGGESSKKGKVKNKSNFTASSSATGELNEKQAQTFMAMLEMNIFRYEIFMDDVKPEQLNVGFLRDFISLPESYFSFGADIIFQNFYLRWGTHYIKSAKFGGQLKIIKTKQATQDLSMSEFATKAEDDWKMTLSTFSAQTSQTKSSSWWHEHESKTESKQSKVEAESGSATKARKGQEKQASSQEYSNECLVVQGGDQKIAAAITEMYTTALTTELKDWLESIEDNPKPFSFVLRPVADILNIPFDLLFPAGEVDYGCFGRRNLTIEKGTGRKYYTQKTTKPNVGHTAADNGTEAVMISEIRYCDFADRKDLKDSMNKKRLALERAVTVYLEEGRLLSSNFLLPAGEAGCETAMLTYLQGDNKGVPTWKEMIGGKEFMVIFDMPYDILAIIKARDVLQLKFSRHMWVSTRGAAIPHLYDSYDNGGSNDVNNKKVSVQGLVMTYNEKTGVFTVTNDDYKASASILPDIPNWIKCRKIARAEYKKLLNHLGQKTDTMGDVPCVIQWSNAHRLNPTGEGNCIHFTAATEGDIFVVFASIPQNYETWVYLQISPEGVALYKAMRLQTTQLNDNAGGLGSATLYQSYFVCVTEDENEKTTVIQYGKMPDNEERPHVWLSFTFHELAYLQYYSFGNGGSPVKVMGLSLMDKPAKDFIICREGTEMINGVCRQKCHPECKGCRTSGSNSPTDCIACRHLKVYKSGEIGPFECLAQCPQHMKAVTATKTCTCIKKMEEARPDGTVDCVTECPLTHFDDKNVCKQCSSFCKDLSAWKKRVCSGPASTDCDTCKYQHEGRCVKGCRPGQKAVKAGGTCPQGYTRYQRSCFKVFGNRKNYYGAKRVCQTDGGSLAMPKDSSTNSFLLNLGNKIRGGPFFIGLSDQNAEGQWRFADNTPLGSFTNWDPGEPNDSHVSGEDCGELKSTGKWNDVKCHSEIQYICEVSLTASHQMGGFICHQCRPGYECKLGDEREVICPAGTASNGDRTMCVPCAAGKYSSTAASSRCLTCPAGQYSRTKASTNCRACPSGLVSRPQSSKCTCKSGYTKFKRSCFKAFRDTRSYHSAERICRAEGGYLAMPKDSATNAQLVRLGNSVARGSSFHIGLHDQRVEGRWYFADGTCLGRYKNWDRGEPNSWRRTNEDCGELKTRNGKWNDLPCSRRIRYICQVKLPYGHY
ncbi:PREDICTED: uncharacterized protein LOC109465000 isoform X3 [Branchiostoma belcheri]|uniref:Uncharacterized protein LOC109465000 isoform X3 n=1 Tax=Branchiostoma belcheri TaxID=7741 RepID=A0A6P4Y5L9_BRABE|nr:PREDICTED: uncharacterized protein LOC109465000 isoform X3 [Branchiostoma belcheri]